MCGVFGVFNSRKATEITYMGLHAIQSRATEYAGIVSSDGHNLFRLVGPGIVQDVFSQADLDQLRGLSAVGHIRYSTVEDNPKCDNAQPLVGPFGDNEIAIAHNGNIINCSHLRGMLKHPDRLKTNIDTEIVLRLICESKEEDTVKRIYGVLRHIRGATGRCHSAERTRVGICRRKISLLKIYLLKQSVKLIRGKLWSLPKPGSSHITLMRIAYLMSLLIISGHSASLNYSIIVTRVVWYLAKAWRNFSLMPAPYCGRSIQYQKLILWWEWQIQRCF